MKRVLTFIVVLSCTFVSAQNINDVLRYSIEETQGTARFQAMGGAFGALRSEERRVGKECRSRGSPDP